MEDPWATISSERLSLVALRPDLLAAMSGERDSEPPFEWPSWWPDETDRPHLQVWQDRASRGAPHVRWGPRALVDAGGQMIGHAGFHLPPEPLAVALDDPTFVGALEPASGGAVEVGYTVFPSHRGSGYATEAVRALVDWAATTGEVAVVLATVADGNDASVRVLERAGGFVAIGTCRSDDGESEVVFRRDL